MIHYALLPGRVAAALVPTKRGWRCRSTRRGALCHDYVSGETIGHVCAWLRLHHPDVVVTADREEVCAALEEDAGMRGNAFQTPDPLLPPAAQVDRMLRQLETGW